MTLPETRTAQGFRPNHGVQQTDPAADESGHREGVRQETKSERRRPDAGGV